MYDLIIIGGGPAGIAGAIYSARKKIKTAIVAKEFGGQSVVSEDVQNWIGTPHISGAELSKNLETHLREYEGESLKIYNGKIVKEVNKEGEIFKIKLDSDEELEAKNLFVATGSSRRKLQAENAEKYEHKGITYCASCDGPLFTGKDVIVIGGGNAGFETSAQLLAYAKSVTLLNRRDKFKADQITVDKVTQHPNFKAILNADTLKIDGEIMVKTLTYKDTKTEEKHSLETDGIFVEIGQIPATNFISHIIDTNDYKQIIINPATQQTSDKQIWAAGDCTNVKYHQNNIAMGDAVLAIEDIYIALNAK